MIPARMTLVRGAGRISDEALSSPQLRGSLINLGGKRLSTILNQAVQADGANWVRTSEPSLVRSRHVSIR